MNELITKIRKGEIDINNQDLFFSILIKGLLLKLDDDISIRGGFIPHFILHTGDDTMWMNMKGYDFSKEPNIFNYSITIIEPKLPYTNLKLYFDFIPITTTEFSEEKVIHTLILELNENDRLETFRIFKDSVSVENLEGSYAIVFYAEVDNIISYIDT